MTTAGGTALANTGGQRRKGPSGANWVSIGHAHVHWAWVWIQVLHAYPIRHDSSGHSLVLDQAWFSSARGRPGLLPSLYGTKGTQMYKS